MNCPPESLRFFFLDPSWVASLVNGVLSISRVYRAHDTAIHKQALGDPAVINSSQLISGFLLRYNAVKGLPILQSNAYDYQFGARSDAVEDNKNNVNRCCGYGANRGLIIQSFPCLEKKRSGVVLQGEKEGGTKIFHDATCKEGSPSILIVGLYPYNQYYELRMVP